MPESINIIYIKNGNIVKTYTIAGEIRSVSSSLLIHSRSEGSLRTQACTDKIIRTSIVSPISPLHTTQRLCGTKRLVQWRSVRNIETCLSGNKPRLLLISILWPASNVEEMVHVANCSFETLHIFKSDSFSDIVRKFNNALGCSVINYSFIGLVMNKELCRVFLRNIGISNHEPREHLKKHRFNVFCFFFFNIRLSDIC